MRYLLNILTVLPILLLFGIVIGDPSVLFGENGLTTKLANEIASGLRYDTYEQESDTEWNVTDALLVILPLIPLVPLGMRELFMDSSESLEHIEDTDKLENIEHTEKTIEQKTSEPVNTKVDMRKKLEAEHNSLRKKIADYQMDIELAIRYPVMNDPTDYFTAKMLEASKQAEVDTQKDDYTYQSSLITLEMRIEQAIFNAQRIALKNVSEQDRKDFNLAQNLLNHLKDKATTAESRVTFANKLREVIERINQRNNNEIVPKSALAEIEQYTRLEILK